MDLESKALPLLEAKMSDGENGHGVLEGYGSVKNDIDAYGDVIVDGAYVELEDLVKSGWSGFNHEGAVGMVMEAREDQKGLFVKIAFHSDPDSQAVRTKIKERMEAGKEVGMSIMYKTLESTQGKRDEQDVRELKKIKVVEVGAVLLPAAKNATVASVKSDGKPFAEQIESLLAGIEDAKSRLDTFQADRKQGLSETNIERAKSLRDGLDSLIAASEPPKSIDPEELKALEPSW